jgi:undecaprenyl diphosphate synthase
MVDKIPKHIAIIPDGNRRWAKGKGLVSTVGHEVGGGKDHIIPLLDEAKKLGITHLSLWAFSTENWKRSESEKKFLFRLLLKMVGEMREYAHNVKIKFKHIGRKDRLPSKLIEAMKDFEGETKDHDGLNVQLLLDYGGRDDIIRAIEKVSNEGKKIDEASFCDYLDTKGIPEPDLVIRTGGEKRLSGLLLFQIAYAELYFCDTYFPDFGPENLREAVKDFSERKRNFGGD